MVLLALPAWPRPQASDITNQSPEQLMNISAAGEIRRSVVFKFVWEPDSEGTAKH
jgi:hypothetical protein